MNLAFCCDFVRSRATWRDLRRDLVFHQNFIKMASRALIVLTALLPTAAAFSTTTPPSGLRVCKNVACKKAGSLDTLDSLFALATTSDEANAASFSPARRLARRAAGRFRRVAHPVCRLPRGLRQRAECRDDRRPVRRMSSTTSTSRLRAWRCSSTSASTCRTQRRKRGCGECTRCVRCGATSTPRRSPS